MLFYSRIIVFVMLLVISYDLYTDFLTFRQLAALVVLAFAIDYFLDSIIIALAQAQEEEEE